MRIYDIDILIVRGDITDVEADAFVYATNNHFYMGDGVGAAIVRKSGKLLEKELEKYRGLKVGEAALVSVHGLKSKRLILAAIMRIDFKTSEELVRRGIANILKCCQENKIASVAFPALGCEHGDIPYEVSSKIMAQELFRYLREYETPSLKKIVIGLHSEDVLDIFNKNVVGYLSHISQKLGKGPFLTVDGIVHYQDGIVLIERSNPPFGWAFPGGFVDYNESVEQAVAREVKEETGLELTDIEQFKVFSAPGSDPRFHTVSVVFSGKGQGELAAASDAKGAQVFKPNEIPPELAFDHRVILDEYLRKNNLP